MQFKQTFKSELQRSQVSERPGEPDNLYSAPHLQQCRVIRMQAIVTVQANFSTLDF